MHSSLSPAQIEQLRRDAKRLARQEQIPLHQSQDRLAQSLGFRNWSLLAKSGGQTQTRIRTSSPTTRRYYLHGDQYEIDPARYYCAECDVFFDPPHFEEKHRVDHGVRALQAIERFEKSPDDFASSVHRPTNALNLLSAAIAAAKAARDAKEAARSPFHRWLGEQKHREDPVGDLAYDIVGDKHFPTGASSLAEVRRHLVNHLASAPALTALRAAWREFEASGQSAPGKRAVAKA
jgi:hypothetical protein